MTTYNEPTQSDFDNAEKLVLDNLNSHSPGLLTKAGSVVRELLVRPFAYLYSWVSTNFSNTIDSATVQGLENSQSTDNEIADKIASNYFISRKEGKNSSGVLTLTLAGSNLHLPGGSEFSVDSITVATPYRIVVNTAGTYGMIDGTLYVKAIPQDIETGIYTASIPVVAQETGSVEIEAGIEATILFSSSVVQSATLTSALTGGSNVETDSELMQRARASTAEAGIGSYYGLKKKLSGAPVDVMDIGVISGEDIPIHRARYNTVSINPGGFVDCYVKTQRQASTVTLTDLTAIRQLDNKYKVTVNDPVYAGFLAVLGVTTNGGPVNDWSVSYISGTAAETGEGARLSNSQKAVITVSISDTSKVSIPLEVTLVYMPGINELQSFMDKDENKFIGQDVRIKAAVPVSLKIDCVAKCFPSLTYEELVLLKQAMADRVSMYPVGTKTLNFSDLVLACEAAIPRLELRLPCTISASVFTNSGRVDTFYSNTGILDIANPVNQDYWDATVCFFSLNPENVRIDQV